MRKKTAVLTVLVLGMTIFTVVNFSGPAMALPDHSLGGMVYICDRSTPLNGTAWEDTTGFAIWTNNTTTSDPFYQWTRYPQSGWLNTSKGYYSAVLPYADKNINWSHGSEYRVEFNGALLGSRITNATSNGTGSTKTTGGGVPIPPDGTPEFTAYGNVSNYLAYWQWGMPVQTDDFQMWDVIINCADLIPANITVDAPGTSIGPLNAPFAVPNAAVVNVQPDEPVVLNASVRNVGPTFVNRTSTIMFWNETAGILDWNVTGHTDPVPAGGFLDPVPKQAIWPGHPTPGIYDLYVTVDYPTIFTEYNGTFGNITEIVDTENDIYNTNNTVRIRVIVGQPMFPDLIPGDTPIPTDILFDGTPVTGAIPPQPLKSNMIYISNNTSYQISSTVTNVGDAMAPLGHVIAFYNCTEFGAPFPPLSLPFHVYTITQDLNPGDSSNPILANWTSPDTLDADFYICIKVDYNDDINEFEENNNTYIIHVHTRSGAPDLLPYDVIVDNDIKINGGSYTPPMTGNISITIATGQVIEIYTKPSNDGDDNAVNGFLFGFFDNATGLTTQAATPSKSFTVPPPLNMGTSFSPSPSDSYVKYYMQEGVYYIFLEVDYSDDVPGEDDETNNVLIIEVNVFSLPPPPEPWLDADDNTGVVTINWVNVTGEHIVAYNIYWAESPDELNFTKPQATVTASGTEITHYHNDGVTEADEFYYVVCSVDVRGWEGPSSDIMGKLTVQIPPGYSTFSLPFEPFETWMASDYLEDMGLEDSDVIFSYDVEHQNWKPHPKHLPEDVSNFNLTMGETYMLYARAGKARYTFFGYPGTTLRYINGTDNPGVNLDDPRLGVHQAFRNDLGASEVGVDIVLTWSWDDAWNRSVFESVGGFNIYRATSRGGFDFSAAPYATINQIATTWTDQNADGDEYYYLVVPVTAMTGREGSSTLAIGVKRMTYEMGYSDFVLYLRPIGDADRLSDHLEALGLTDIESIGTIFWFDNFGTQSWIPHPVYLPDEITNPDTALGEGNMIYLLIAKDYTMIGR
jgi:hypothetical protein